MGWDSTNFTLQQAVDDCTDLSGTVEACEHFTVISEAEQQSCTFDMPEVLKIDDVAGPMDDLPGKVALAWGPAPARAVETLSAIGAVKSTELATLSYSAGSTATNNGSLEQGNVFVAAATTMLTATTTPLITAAPITTGPDAQVTLATSRYTFTDADGDVTIKEIVYEEAVTWVTEMTTTTVYVEPTGVARRDAHVHAHKHRHARGHNY